MGNKDKEYICSETKNLNDLFAKNYSYIIPGYQRPYEWEEKQLEKVFQSVYESYKKAQPCVMGTIQLNEFDKDTYQIIDGQQRLTTFWLLLSVLGNEDLLFEPSNEIDSKYETDLKLCVSSKGADYSFCNTRYKKNYDTLVKWLNRAPGEETIDYLVFASYIRERVLFVVVETKLNDNIEKTIEIFDSLNTTGLPLDTKDIFKIKYYDCLKAQEGGKERIFETINKAYSNVLDYFDASSPYYLTEDDLLSTFKYWIIGNYEQSSITANLMKQSNNAFFCDTLLNRKNGKLPETASLDTFCEISGCISKTQMLLSKMDERDGSVMLSCAKELLAWSGYGVLKDLFYVFVYAQTHGGRVDEGHIVNALELTELVWKMCSLFHAVVEQIIKDVFAYVGQEILFKVIHEPFFAVSSLQDAIKEFASKHWRLNKDNVNNVLFKDMFNNTRRWLFLAISYIDDSEDCNPAEVKKTLFYNDKWDLDIEHILSQKFFDKQPICNQIGNLMFLERRKNRGLGRKTGEINTIEEDFINKKLVYLEDSGLNSVKRVQEKLKLFDSLEELVNERNEEKKKMLKLCYSAVYNGLCIEK